jgi:hypothetical protein
MSKYDVLTALETDMNDLGSYKSGEYLEEHVLMHARYFLPGDRSGLVEAMREWINLRSEPRTMLAVKIADELGLREMISDIEALRREIASAKIFPSFYLHDIDNALNSLR